MFKRLNVLIAMAVVASCAGDSSRATPQAAGAGGIVPTGATIGVAGHATIRDAPPAPTAPAEPDPAPSTAPPPDHGEFGRVARFQNAVMAEVHALAERLRAAERGNFVDPYFENEGEPHVVFRFLRDAEATLARYSRDPRFRAATARFSNEQLQAAADFMLATFRDDRVIQGIGLGNKNNRAEVEIAVTEAEFRALVARKSVAIPDAVLLHFQATEPASVLNRPLPPDIARLVRIFPRNDRPFGALNAINSHAKVVLADGCFRVSGGEHDGALVLFPLGAQLFVDGENYLAFGDREAPGYARVGERLVFPGSIGEVTAPELAAPIRAACGPGRIIALTATRSAAADGAAQAARQNAQALRLVQESYGLSEAVARRVVARCGGRSASGTCLVPPPPPPPPGGPACPPGTASSFGMCRTPEGFVRPIPDWIQALMRD